MSEVGESQAQCVRRQQLALERADPLALELLGVLALVNLPLTEDEWLMQATGRRLRAERPTAAATRHPRGDRIASTTGDLDRG